MVYQMLERNMRPLVQEYIEESHGQDIRAFVVGGKVVAAMRRKARGGEFRSNFHLGAKVEKLEIPDKHSEIACKAAETMGLDIAGVDLLESSRGALVLEVNSSPGLEGIEAASGVNVASKIIQHLNRIWEQKMAPDDSSEVPTEQEVNDEGTSEAY